MPGKEIETCQMVSQALKDGKNVFVPYIHKAPQDPIRVIDMLLLQSQEDLDSLRRDSWGIPAFDPQSIPDRRNALGGYGISDGERGEIRVPELDLVILPGIAFDRSMGRLGHGKGFYDRYLERYKKAVDEVGQGAHMPILSKSGLLQITPCA